MEQKVQEYDAFISYTHHDNSARLADMLCRKMEQYVIPVCFRSHTGKQIKVFVDHNETSEYKGVISAFETYLLHSRCLISICSTEYKRSRFSIEREISYAREHDMRIIAVMVDGPDSLPDGFLDKDGKPVPSVALIDFSKGNSSQNTLRIIAEVIGVPYAVLWRYQVLRHFMTTGWSAGVIWAFIILFGLWCAAGAIHPHIFMPATCTSPKRCVFWVREGLMQFSPCDATSESALGHSIIATETTPCITQIRCRNCDLSQTVYRHQMTPTDEGDKLVCAVCGLQQEE